MVNYSLIVNMNIKKLIKNQFFRHRLLRLFSWIPDRVMLSLQYYLILHRWPNMKQAKRFTEKIQCYKAFYRNSKMLNCVDKYKVRKYVEEKLGTTKYLNTLYQVCDRADDIDFDSLPNQFVIKTTDGGNGDNVLICRNKFTLDIASTIQKINSWRNKKYYSVSREWAYVGAKQSKVIIEKYLESPENADDSIDDYKFLCYNGKFRFLWVDKNRYSNHCRGFWNENLCFLENVKSDHPTFKKAPDLPGNIREMIDVAERLSEDFPFARVDMYNIQGQILFGEITFYPWSGYVQYYPDSFDYELGKYFTLY